MCKANIHIKLKSGVHDPQGKVILNTLHTLGFDNVKSVRTSKYFELEIENENNMDLTEQIDKICDKVLANPNIETYEFNIENHS